MSEELVWKVNPQGVNGSSIVIPEQVSIIEKENYEGNTDKFFESKEDALEYALEIQNNVVNDLTGSFNDVDKLNQQSMLLGTLLSVSLMNMAKVKGNESLSNMEVWINFFNKVLGLALGNIDTKNIEDFQDVVSIDDIKSYLFQWIIVYLSRFCKSTPTEEVQREVAEMIMDMVQKSYEKIVESNINNELKESK
jgi:hypothetical protein